MKDALLHIAGYIGFCCYEIAALFRPRRAYEVTHIGRGE